MHVQDIAFLSITIAATLAASFVPRVALLSRLAIIRKLHLAALALFTVILAVSYLDRTLYWSLSLSYLANSYLARFYLFAFVSLPAALATLVLSVRVFRQTKRLLIIWLLYPAVALVSIVAEQSLST